MRRFRPRWLALVVMLIAGQGVFAGGPRWVAGSSYFNATAKGQPIHWKNGVVSYYLDQGSLGAVAFGYAMPTTVANVAAGWNKIPTTAVTLTQAGFLNEDVNGSNVTVSASGVVSMPTDIQSTATSKPLAIIYDLDGSVINAIYGKGASDPSDCRDNGVMTLIDNVAADGTILHARMILNGLCANNEGQYTVLQYQMLRGFGRILGLDWSQANESMFVGDQITTNGVSGWPIMHPVEYLCDITGVTCTLNGASPRYDDIAALGRMYPVTTANIASFPGKKLTTPSTISVQGTIHFQSGQGMQGVNVVLRPLTQGTNTPDIRYTVSAVSGVFFQGQAATPVNGPNDSQGNPLNEYGSDDTSLEGWFDLSGVPLPLGETTADYQLTFEPINPLYTAGYSVGPYTQGQVTPSGTMPTIILHDLKAGSAVTQDVVIQDSAGAALNPDDGTEENPVRVSPTGEWTGRIAGYGHTAWFGWPVRPNRELTIEGTALDETGAGSENKARLVLGAWNGTDVPGSTPVAATPQPFNGAQVGLTTLSVATVASGSLRLGIADSRGDGRPDYIYSGRLLYADSVMPSLLSLDGGPITIHGVGFRANSIVKVNGVNAPVTSVTPTEITAIAPPANGATGVVLLTVSDPATLGITAIQAGLSYDAMGGDSLGIVAAPLGTVGIGVPMPFVVKALASDARTPVAGANVTFAVTEGTASLDCGKPSCTVVTQGDGTAAIHIAADTASLAQVAASLSDGASVLTEFTGSAPPSITALTPDLYVAIGANVSWTPQAQLLSNGAPLVGQTVNWSAGSGVVPIHAATASDATGVASTQVMVSALAAGADVPVNACLVGNTACAQFQVYSVHPEVAELVGVSGVGQTIQENAAPVPVVIRVTDSVGHPMAGAVVTFYETLKQWTSACPSVGRCPSAPTLAATTVQVTSGADGLVTLAPLAQSGTPTRLYVTVVTGNVASLNFEIDSNP